MLEHGLNEAEGGRGQPAAHETRITAGTCRTARKSNSLSLAPGAASARETGYCKTEVDCEFIIRRLTVNRKRAYIEKHRGGEPPLRGGWSERW